MRYYIGADGGGTKTHLALFDENKNVLRELRIAGTNHENYEGGIPEAARLLLDGIHALLGSAGLRQSDIARALFALAGIDHPYQAEEMTAALKSRGFTVPFTVCNDGFIIPKAGSENRAAIGYNCGTGTCCDSADEDGKLLQIGGLCALTGDVGGGVWIAGQVFRMVYDDVCLLLRPTACTAFVSKKRAIRPDRDGILSLAPLLETEDPALIRDLIDVFFDALNGGDAPAVEVARRMAVRGAEYITAHLRNGRFDSEPVDVVLSGSIHTKLPSGRYIEMLEAETEKRTDKRLRFIRLRVPPVYGCINWMLQDET